MRLPNFLDDPQLNELRARMGTSELGSFRLSVNAYRFTIGELEQLIINGIRIRYLDEVRPLPDNTLAYKDRRILLHPHDATWSAALPPFHFADCARVRDMRHGNDAGGHIVSAREDGKFQIHMVSAGASRASLQQLPACAACASELGIAAFTISRFFEKYRRNVLPESVEEGIDILGAG